MPDTATKICSACKRELPADAEHFYAHKGGSDGLTAKCRECKSADERANRAALAVAKRVKDAAREAVERQDAERKLEFDAALAPLVALTDEVPRAVADLSTPQGRAVALRRQESRRALMDSLRPRFEAEELFVDMAKSAADVETLGKSIRRAVHS